MKKKSRVRGNVKFESAVLSDGICMKAFKRAGPISVGTNGIAARLKDNQKEVEEMDEEAVWQEIRTYEDFIGTIAKKVRIGSFIFIGINIVSSIFLVPYPYFKICLFLAMAGISGAIASRSLAYFILKTFKKGEHLSKSRFKGAVNTVINAYYDLGRVPTMEELRDYSRFSIYDSCNDELKKAVPFIIGGLINLGEGWMYLLFLGIEIVALIILLKTNLIYGGQALVISKPSEEQLELALLSLKEALKCVEDIEISQEAVSFEEFTKNCESCDEKENCKSYRMMKKVLEG